MELTQITVLQNFTMEGLNGIQSKLKLKTGDKFMTTPPVLKLFKAYAKIPLVSISSKPVNNKLNVYDGRIVWKRKEWNMKYDVPKGEEPKEEIKIDTVQNLENQFDEKTKGELVEFLYSIDKEFTVPRLNRMKRETLVKKIVAVLMRHK